MLFSLFSRQGHKDGMTLLIDIGSASVGAALVMIEKGKPPRIVATNHKEIPFQETLSSANFLSAMNRALDHALKDAQKTAKGIPPRSVFCTLSSPWFIVKSRHLGVEHKENFEVTERALNEFVDQDIDRLKEELKDVLPPKDTVVIEKKIIHMKLNGYEVKNPYGQETNRLELVAMVSISSRRVIENIERKVGQFFHTKDLQFNSFPVTAFNAIRDIFPEEQDYLFLDITGEATDVSLVRHGLLVGTVSFPRGKNFFIREISSHFKTPHTDAATLFSMFNAGTLEKKKNDEVAEIIWRGGVEWSTRFEGALAVLAQECPIPHTVLFTADNDVPLLFGELIDKAKSNSMMANNFESRYVDQFIVAKLVSFESGVLRDPFLAIEALLAKKVIESAV